MSATDRQRLLVLRALDVARRTGRRQWVATHERVAIRDPLATLRGSADRFYWERPAEDFAISASGSAHTIEVRGALRFARAAELARDLFTRVHTDAEDAPPGEPLLVGGFAFADQDPGSEVWSGFPAGRLVLPERLLVRRGRQTWCTAVSNVLPGDEPARVLEALDARRRAGRAAPSIPPGESVMDVPSYHAAADRPHAAYRALADAALAALAAGDVEKVVLARSIALTQGTPFEARAILDRLRGAHPSCAAFAVGRDERTFLGATPEPLLRLSDGRIETAALAGSSRRGRTPEEDARLGRALIESKKEQTEHAVVVRALRAALEPHCRRLRVPEAPTLLRLEGIQHLETRMVGEQTDDAHLLELAGALHPTPAVGGAPRAEALDWIARNEELDRGWYAGAVGWVDATGGGELAVALRSALLSGAEARLFAGAGIVPGSDPALELAETRLKLRALLSPMLEI